MILVFSFTAEPAAAAVSPSCSSNLDVIKFKDSSFEMAGDVISEDEQRVVMRPENGGRIELRRELIDKIEYDIRPPKQVTTEELVNGFTHCVAGLIGNEKEFRVVKVRPESVYLNLGAEGGARPGIELSIYREGEKVLDPGTGSLLGKEKDFIGVVQIIIVEEEFAKAVPVDVSADRFQEGDTGIYMPRSPVLAIAGVMTDDGQESPYGMLLSEKLIGKFSEDSNLRVIERRHLGKVLRELAIQNALLTPLSDRLSADAQKRPAKIGTLEADATGPALDSSIAEKVKGIEGADAIVFGTVTDVDGKGAVNLRVVDTSSAAILFSTYKMVGNPEKPIEASSSGDETVSSDGAVERTEARPVRGESPDKLGDLLDRILRALYQR